MSKLFTSNDIKEIEKLKIVNTPILSTSVVLEEINLQVDEVTRHIAAYKSLDNVYETIANESFIFNDDNYKVYSDSIKSISDNLNIRFKLLTSEAALESSSLVTLTHSIALEGFIGDIWAKIKAAISTLFNKIKEFFKRWFTRLGRCKTRLNNLEEVLKETKKDIQTVTIEKAPSSLLNKYPFSDNLNEGIVKAVTSNTNLYLTNLNSVTNVMNDFSKLNLIEPSFLDEYKKRRDDIKNLKNEKGDQVKENKETGSTGLFGTSVGMSKTNNEKAKEGLNKVDDLNTKIDTKEAEKANDDKTLNKLSDSALKDNDIDDNDKVQIAIKKDIEKLNTSIEKIASDLKGKEIINGKTFKQETTKEADGEAEIIKLFTIDDIENKKTEASLTLAGKSVLLGLISDSKKILETASKTIDTVSKIDDVFGKRLTEVDKVIYELDKVSETSNQEFNKYKKQLDKVVRQRLMLLKSTFVGFNKLSTNLLELSLDTCDGVVDYATLSLKNFG